MSIESQLRVALHDAAGEVTTSTPPDAARAVGMREQHRRHTRRRNSALAVGLAAVLVAVAVPVGLTMLRTSSEVATPAPPPADIFGVPTRGSLATDEAAIAAIAALPWTSELVNPNPGALDVPDPPVDERHVVFAGDVPNGGRWALVVGPNTARPTGDAADPNSQTDLGAISELAGAWFVGPEGAGAEQMTLATIPRGIIAERPASLADEVSGATVVVAAPGDVIEISVRPEVAADTTVSRVYVESDAENGVLVTTVGGDPYRGLPAVQYRVTRAGTVVAEGGPDGLSSADGEFPDPVDLTYLRPPLSRPGGPAGDEQMMATGILGQYGLTPDQLQLRVHYVGPIPGSEGAAAGLTVLTATFPSGAVLARAFWLQEVSAGAYGGSQCVDAIFPAGVPAADRLLAFRCDVAAGSGGLAEAASTLVVLAPPDTTAISASVLGGGERSMDLVGGVGMIPFPDGAQEVRIIDAAGTAVATTSILTG